LIRRIGSPLGLGPSSLLLAAAIGAASPPAPARAADATPAGPTPGQAAALEAGARAFLAPLLAPLLPPGAAAPDLSIVPAGDHYALSLPASWLTEPNQQVTATLRPLDGGRFAVDDIGIPAQGHLAGKVRLPGGEPPGAPETAGPVRLGYSIAQQSAHAVIDPTLASPSTFFAALHGVTADTTTDGFARHDRLDAVSLSFRLQPTTDGRIDAAWTTDLDGMRYDIRLPDAARPQGAGLAGAVAHQSGTLRLSHMDRAQAAALIGAAAALAGAPTPDRTARLQALVRSLAGLGATISGEETAQDVRIDGPAGHVALGALHATLDGAAPGGALSTRVAAGIDGLAVGGLSPGLEGILPKHVDLALSLSGLRAAEVEDLAVAALAPGASTRTLAPRIDALFAPAGAPASGLPIAGIDALRFDLGPAQVDGHGTLAVRGPQDLRGTARIALSGFDALAERLRADPDLAQGAIFLALARSVARQEGGQMVWDIAVTPEAVTINGVDPRKLLQSQP